MVEFAIALPILLMLVYGLLEVGRLLFTYSSVVNATRQAVRYGSTTGAGDRGTPLDTADDAPPIALSRLRRDQGGGPKRGLFECVQ